MMAAAAMSSDGQVPAVKASTPPKASPRRRPQTARPTTHPSSRAKKSTATISARGAAAVSVGKRGRVVRGTLGNSNRRAVAQMCGSQIGGAANLTSGGARPASAAAATPNAAAIGGPTTVRRDDTAANVVRSPTDASFAAMVRPQPPARSTTLNVYRDAEQSRPVTSRRPAAPRFAKQKTEAKARSTTSGKGAVPLMVLSPRHSRRPAPPQTRSPPRPEAPEPVKSPPEPQAPRFEAPPPTLQTLSEPHQPERPATPAAATPRFLQSAVDAAKAASRRQALAASPKPGFRRRPQSAPAVQRRLLATARKGEPREVTVAEHMSFNKVDRRWASPESAPVPMVPDPRAAQPGRYPVEGGYGIEGVSGIGLSDQNGVLSKIRDRMRESRLAPALHRCDPDHTGTIDAASFHKCLHELDVSLSEPQVQWIFSAVRSIPSVSFWRLFETKSFCSGRRMWLTSAWLVPPDILRRSIQLGVDGSHPDARMDYSKFCEKLHAETRVGMAKNAYENHSHSDKWIFRKEEVQPARPFVESKAVTLLPREGVDPGSMRGDVIEIAHPHPPAHYTAATAPWSGSRSVMGRILAPDDTSLQTLKANREFYARGKEGWVAQAGMQRKAATDRYRDVMRENRVVQTAVTSARQQVDVDRIAQKIAKRSMKENFRRDLYEANARSNNIANNYRKYEGECLHAWPIVARGHTAMRVIVAMNALMRLLLPPLCLQSRVCTRRPQKNTARSATWTGTRTS
jgi:hypothetical protein